MSTILFRINYINYICLCLLFCVLCFELHCFKIKDKIKSTLLSTLCNISTSKYKFSNVVLSKSFLSIQYYKIFHID